MKKLILILFIPFFIKGQSLSYSELSWDSFDPKSSYDTYTTKDGTVYKVGGEVKISQPKSGKAFTFVTEGDGLLMAVTPLPSNYSGSTLTIKNIIVTGRKKIGYSVVLRCKGIAATISVNIDNAIEAKEVVTGTISSDEALEMLKKEKDKYDLGLITKEEYEAKKEELAPYIK